MRLEPFWYQEEAINSAMDFLFESTGNAALELPTSAGKSLIAAELARRIRDVVPDMKVLVLTDLTALIPQLRDEMMSQWPECKASVYSATYDQKSTKGDVIYAGIQSSYKKPELFGDVSVIIIDEVHRASLNKNGMYYKFYSGIKKFNPHVRIIGMSGTPWKMEGSIEGTWICDKVVYRIPISLLFEQGFITPLITPKLKTQADLSGVRTTRSGEYDEDEMAKVMDDNHLVSESISEAVSLSGGRNAILVFACNISHAEHIKRELESHGEDAKIIVGETDTDERKEIIAEFNDFKLRWLISVGVLTTGFSSKVCDCGVILRATKSSALWLQILGRMMRKHPSKTDSLILDFGGSVQRFGPVDKIGPPPTKEQKKQAKKTPFKICPECKSNGFTTMVPYLDHYCPKCDFEFGGDLMPNHGTQASTESITEFKQEIREISLTGINYSKHTDKHGKVALKVSYVNGIQFIDDYLYFDGEPWQRLQACRWWEMFADEEVSGKCPKHVETALTELNAFGINNIKRITVDVTSAKTTPTGSMIGHKIIGYEFEEK